MSGQIIPAIIAFALVTALSPVFIALLRKLKLLQPIRKELPSNHQLKKGTPLMLPGIIRSSWRWGNIPSRRAWHRSNSARVSCVFREDG